MPEELNPDSLSDRTIRQAGIMDAIDEAARLEDRTVVDVNGVTLGRVTKCFVRDGRLAECQVTLSEDTRREWHVPEDVARFPTDVVASTEGEDVRLRVAAEQLLHPGDPRPPGAETDLRGSDTLPRKVR